MTRTALRLALWTGFGAALLVTGYLLLNTTFMPYDDEGFVLISLRNYLAGQRLYDDVFSQYGPWPYVYHQLVSTLLGHAPVTHTLGRALTLLHWTGTALLCALIAWRLTRSQLAAALAAVFVFTLTWQMTSEPSHPGSHIALLVALAGVIAAGLPGARRPVLAAVGWGVLSGLLLLTKVNVGLLLVAAIGAVALRYSDWPPRWRWIAWIGPAGLLAVPWVLLGRQLPLDWARTFAVLLSAATAGWLWVTPPARMPVRLPARAWGATALAALATVAIFGGWVLLRGTTWQALVDTVLFNPLRMPARFMVAVNWYAGTVPLAVIAGLITLKAGWDFRRQGELTRTGFVLVAAARGAVLLAFLLQATQWPTYYGIFHFMSYCVPLVPLFVIPVDPRVEPGRRLAGWLVAGIALLQILHAYPVAGSQLGWATFLVVPVLIAGWWELGAALVARGGPAGARLAQAGALGLGGAALVIFGLFVHTGWIRFTTSRPLDLPGAEAIRLDGPTRQGLRLLNLNARIHADVLFSRQGMYSHNLWSGVPTPTSQNATHWFWLLDEPQQQAVIARLAATPRTAVITSMALDHFMVDFKVPVTGPLADFVLTHYRPLFQYRDFVFHVPVDSTAVAFGRYEILEAGSGETAGPPLLIRTNVLLDGTPAQLRMEMMDYPWTDGPDFLAPGTQVYVQSIDRSGRDLGPARRLAEAGALHGLYRLTILGPRLPPKLPWQDYAIRVRAADGTLLSESAH